MLTEDMYEDIRLDRWSMVAEHFQKYVQSGRQWVFRGQADARWLLATTLERSVFTFWGCGTRREEDHDCCLRALRSGVRSVSVHELASQILTEFKRQYRNYSDKPPAEQRDVEWLSLLQHHGGPSRLLDWTYSLPVAIFFSLETATNDAVVWALDSDYLESRLRNVLDLPSQAYLNATEDREELFVSMLNGNPSRQLVYPINPLNLTKRLIIQQGVFICTGDLTQTFEDNLSAMMENRSSSCFLKRHVIPHEQREAFMVSLHRMNINRAVLFPDLDGLARSLITLVQPVLLRQK